MSSDSYFSELSWFRQEKVDSAKIMVVGCGALGNEVLKNLILFGVGNIWIVDFDKVELHNLNRSVLFRNADALSRRLKVEAAADRLQELNPNVKIHTIVGDFCHDVGLGLIMQMDVVVGCVDNRWTRFIINRFCMRAKVPWVDGGIDGLDGTARVFVPGRNCYACNMSGETKDYLQRRMSCSTSIRRNEESQRVPTTPVVASVIGAIQAQEALKLLHREQLENGDLTSLCGRMFYYDGQHMTTRILRFETWDEDCAEHTSFDVKLGKFASRPKISELIESGYSIRLLNFSFVDFIEDKQSGEPCFVMMPDYRIEGYLATLVQYKGKLPSQFYQHSFKVIDAQFPYKNLDWKELGFPENDVVELEKNGEIIHILLR